MSTIDVKLIDRKTKMKPEYKVLDKFMSSLPGKGYSVFYPKLKTKKCAIMKITSPEPLNKAGFRKVLEEATDGLDVDFKMGKFIKI